MIARTIVSAVERNQQDTRHASRIFFFFLRHSWPAVSTRSVSLLDFLAKQSLLSHQNSSFEFYNGSSCDERMLVSWYFHDLYLYLSRWTTITIYITYYLFSSSFFGIFIHHLYLCVSIYTYMSLNNNVISIQLYFSNHWKNYEPK